jgi:phage terminase small subunit
MLNERQKLFCDFYVISFNACEAYEKAGYNCKDRDTIQKGSAKLLMKPHIKEYIRNRLKAKEDGLIIKQNEILAYLSGCIRGTEKEKHVVVTRSGDKGCYDDEVKTIEIELKARDRIRACEIMAKIYKLMDRPIDGEPTIIINNSIPRKEA